MKPLIIFTAFLISVSSVYGAEETNKEQIKRAVSGDQQSKVVQLNQIVGAWQGFGYESIPPKDIEPRLFNYMIEISFYLEGNFESIISIDPHEERRLNLVNNTPKIYGQWELKDNQIFMKVTKSIIPTLIPIGKEYEDEIIEISKEELKLKIRVGNDLKSQDMIMKYMRKEEQ